jgi:hypothetical protein
MLGVKEDLKQRYVCLQTLRGLLGSHFEKFTLITAQQNFDFTKNLLSLNSLFDAFLGKLPRLLPPLLTANASGVFLDRPVSQQ